MNSNSTSGMTLSDEAAAPASDAALLDDLDLNEPLGERKGAACSMEEGCESCQ